MSIVQHAEDYDLSQYDFALLRQKAFDEKLRARLEAAKQAHQEKENQDSSISSSDDDENEEKTSLSTMAALISHMKQLRIE